MTLVPTNGKEDPLAKDSLYRVAAKFWQKINPANRLGLGSEGFFW
jgi:hypothetical protein